ncbi:MAG: hypothetical protein K8I02_06420, partial [Candidatus Methylomirabilis sp.]|nr:hypothetical protein [Deltaproteobacteria bacterium]
MQLRDRPTALEPVPDADPEGYDRDPSKTVYLQLVPSTADALTVPDSALWLAALRTAREPIAFEIVGSAAGIRLYFVAQQRDAPLLRSALARATSYAYLDEVRPNPLNAYWDAVLKSDLKSRLSFDFRDAYLDGPDHLTLADPPRRDHSPLEPLLETLATLPPYACGFYQALFAPAERDWARDFRAYLGSRTTSFETLSVPDAYGWPQQRVLTRREHPELSDAELAAHEHRAKPKHDPTTPLFALCARFGVIGLREHFPARFGALKAVLAAYSAPPRRFQVLTRADYRAQGFETEDLRYLFRNRISYRPGQIVSAAELAALVHIPPPATLELFRGDLGPGVARLGRIEQVGRTAAAPATPADGQLLGVNT